MVWASWRLDAKKKKSIFILDKGRTGNKPINTTIAVKDEKVCDIFNDFNLKPFVKAEVGFDFNPPIVTEKKNGKRLSQWEKGEIITFIEKNVELLHVQLFEQKKWQIFTDKLNKFSSSKRDAADYASVWTSLVGRITALCRKRPVPPLSSLDLRVAKLLGLLEDDRINQQHTNSFLDLTQHNDDDDTDMYLDYKEERKENVDTRPKSSMYQDDHQEQMYKNCTKLSYNHDHGKDSLRNPLSLHSGFNCNDNGHIESTCTSGLYSSISEKKGKLLSSSKENIPSSRSGSNVPNKLASPQKCQYVGSQSNSSDQALLMPQVNFENAAEFGMTPQYSGQKGSLQNKSNSISNAATDSDILNEDALSKMLFEQFNIFKDIDLQLKRLNEKQEETNNLLKKMIENETTYRHEFQSQLNEVVRDIIITIENNYQLK